MPNHWTRSRLMRNKSINPNPPICRSKNLPFGTIVWYECAPGSPPNYIHLRALTLPEFQHAVNQQTHRHGTWRYIDTLNNIDIVGTFDNCTYPYAGEFYYVPYRCSDHHEFPDRHAHFSSVAACLAYLNTLTGEYGGGIYTPDNGDPIIPLGYNNCP